MSRKSALARVGKCRCTPDIGWCFRCEHTAFVGNQVNSQSWQTRSGTISESMQIARNDVHQFGYLCCKGGHPAVELVFLGINRAENTGWCLSFQPTFLQKFS